MQVILQSDVVPPSIPSLLVRRGSHCSVYFKDSNVTRIVRRPDTEGTSNPSTGCHVQYVLSAIRLTKQPFQPEHRRPGMGCKA